MTTKVITADMATPYQTLAELLQRHQVNVLPVITEDGRVAGVVSEADLHALKPPPPRWWRRGRHARVARRVAWQLMSTPAITVQAGASIGEAARLLADHRINLLPVVDGHQHLAGIVGRRDLLNVFFDAEAELDEETADAAPRA